MLKTDIFPGWRSWCAILLVLTAAISIAPVQAQDGAEARSHEDLLNDISNQRRYIGELDKRLVGASGLKRDAIDTRLVRARLELLQLNQEFVEQAAGMIDKADDAEALRQQAIEVLKAQLQDINATRDILVKRIELPEEKLPAAESAVVFNRIFQQIAQLNNVYEIHLEGIELARELELDVDAETARLKQNLRDRAENGSILLEMVMSEVIALRASVSAVPDDAETKARLGVMTATIGDLTEDISRLLEMMNNLEMDTTKYQNQLLAATGEITTDIFQVGVFTNLFIGWGETLWSGVIENGPGLVFKLFILVLLIFLFYKLSIVARRITERAIDNSHLEFSQLLRRMVISTAGNAVLLVGVLVALAQIGISLGPLLAGMGLVGFVIGFALQDTLSNFAAGVLILIYRPFDVDDYIEAGGVSGLVSEMSLVNTTILTFDNQTIIVPNGKIWGDVIKNVTAQTIRRIDLVFGIAYSDDIEKAEKVMAEVVAAHPAVLDEPATNIRLHELGDSSVNFVVRPWVNKDDYWDTYWDLMRAMKMRFDEEGISIPFPQRDVHLFKESPD